MDKIEEATTREEEEGEEEQGEQETDVESKVEELKAELDAAIPPIVVPISDVSAQIPKFDLSEFPDSYKENSPKEKLVLENAENFRRQYVHLFRDRKPLFLNPLNECGIEKFVCTTMRPTLLKFKELYHWQGCAEFVSDYITMMPLDPPCDLPTTFYSPTTILKQQKGNCFDFSNLLCLFLLGAGYDAYVVSGYAIKEVCLYDESREICPLLKKKEEVKVEPPKPEPKKYAVRPPRDLRSKFIIKMEERRKKQEADEEEKQRIEEEEKIKEAEKPPPDPLYGLRVHSWIVVRGGKREVPEDFFIEPFTGVAYSPSSSKFLGIESVWNHLNYWANMQECSNGCKDLSFELTDTTKWEYMFIGSKEPGLEIPDLEDEIDDFDDLDEEGKDDEKHLDMPASWVKRIEISERDYDSRCPQGKKTILYKKAKLEKYAPYLLKEGLIERLTVFNNNELTDLQRVEERFANREDKLKQRKEEGGIITEEFVEGRPRSLCEHTFKAKSPNPESERVMIFYHSARVDGLSKREETPAEMKEYYENREDFLYFRHIIFGKRVKKLAPAVAEGPPRPILRISEYFHRNKDILANADIAERIFILSEDKIQLSFHRENENITMSTREFFKPPNAEEKTGNLQWTPDMTATFQIDTHASPSKHLAVYDQLVELIQLEQKSIQLVRASEEEVREILLDRQREEMAHELSISVYDTERNEKAKKHRKELEIQAQEEKLRRQEMEMDYLAPFLAQIGNPDKITKTQAFKLKEDCMADLKQRLIDKANLIQLRFEKETGELHRRQQDYQQKQVTMTKEDEEEYFNFCSEAMFRIHILELRLNRHKQMAPHKYMQLESRLRGDQRLSGFF
ncbi:dynein regulatory complex subunit 7-like [Styela clava]